METKKCTYCKETKPLSEYYPVANGVKGVRPRCKVCMLTLERTKYSSDEEFRIAKLKSQANWLRDPDNLKEHRKRARRWHLKASYGMGLDDYDKMVDQQNGRCAVCEELPTDRKARSSLVVDHCHNTGKVRGLLCDLCNTAIGKMRDDADLVLKAARYLQRHSNPDKIS